ncbi:MAG: flagellar filament capping protein FliD [Rubrivivax sp.]|nr:flagellar filament capping protein FliD [Rubrivivax sp.]
MASFTSLGVGSGLDLNTIVTQLVALERQPLVALQNKASQLNSQISLFGKVNSLFSGLQTAANKLTDTTLWQKSTVASSNSSVVTATGTTGAAGSYAVTVQNLAGNQTVALDTALSDAEALVGQGTLRLQLGSWNADQSEFTAKSGSAELSIDVTATDTLATLRDKINAAGGGVTASLVTDTTGVRLALRSESSGMENGFRLSVDDIDGSLIDTVGLSRFAFDPAVTTSGLVLKQSAANARAIVNGIAVESASNEISGAVDGVTLTVLQESATATQVTVKRDKDAVVAAVKTFAEAYNAVVSYLAEQTKYDAGSKVAGALQGDSTAVGLMSQLRGVLNASSGASASFPRLSDLGLEAQRDGTLVVDTAKLDAATADLDELKKAFGNADSLDASNNGFARRYATLATQVLGTDGALNTRTSSLQKLVSKNSDEQDKLNERVERVQARLVAQYTALDSNVAKLNSLSSYVTQMIAQMNKSTT